MILREHSEIPAFARNLSRHPAAEFRRLICHSRALAPPRAPTLIREMLINSARARAFHSLPILARACPKRDGSPLVAIGSLRRRTIYFSRFAFSLTIRILLGRNGRGGSLDPSTSALTDAGKSIDGSFKWYSDIFRCNPGLKTRTRPLDLLIVNNGGKNR